MRIDIHLIIAVLFLAAILFPCSTSTYSHNFYTSAHRPVKRTGRGRDNQLLDRYPESPPDKLVSKQLLAHYLMVLEQEGSDGRPVECCPSVIEMVEPAKGGRDQDDNLVELYSDPDNKQRFYEISCRSEILNKPCRFLDRKLHNQSRCVQKYSYTYALVRDTNNTDTSPRRSDTTTPTSSKQWKMDYIKVRSGCSCEVTPNKTSNKKRNSKNKKKKGTHRGLLDYDEDET